MVGWRIIRIFGEFVALKSIAVPGKCIYAEEIACTFCTRTPMSARPPIPRVYRSNKHPAILAVDRPATHMTNALASQPWLQRKTGDKLARKPCPPFLVLVQIRALDHRYEHIRVHPSVSSRIYDVGTKPSSEQRKRAQAL